MSHDQLHSHIEDLKRQAAFLAEDISDLERREQILNLGRAEQDLHPSTMSHSSPHMNGGGSPGSVSVFVSQVFIKLVVVTYFAVCNCSNAPSHLIRIALCHNSPANIQIATMPCLPLDLCE